jgi:hypothetical protein
MGGPMVMVNLTFRVPNHVHADFTDIYGRRFNPWSNKVVVPSQLEGAKH